MSAIESYDRQQPFFTDLDTRVVCQKIIDQTPTLETRNGVRKYNVLCLLAEDPDTNEVCIVRKAHEVDSSDPTDWLVLRYLPESNELLRDTVLHARTEKNDAGDTITLELSPLVAHQGSSLLTFSVDKMYQHGGKTAKRERVKYYGRGVGPTPERYLDAMYSKSLVTVSESDHDAEIVSLDGERARRSPLGYAAIAGN